MMLTTSTLAYGATETTQYSAEVGIGAEYDSNVAINEVDLSSSESDYALTLDLSLGSRTQFTDNFDVDLSYDYSQNSYDEFSGLNRQTHILGANLNADLGKLDSGISFFYINSRLDHQNFLEFYRTSPSLSGFLAKKWFARAAYVYSDKSLAKRSARNAISNAGEFDLYYFHRGLRSYFNFGYRYKYENAQAKEFDYRSGGLKLRYIRRFDLLSRVAIAELALRYEDRDYNSETPELGENRADNRERWRVALEVPLTEKGSVNFYYGYGDYDSNLQSADYSQKLIGTRFSYRW